MGRTQAPQGSPGRTSSKMVPQDQFEKRLSTFGEALLSQMLNLLSGMEAQPLPWVKAGVKQQHDTQGMDPLPSREAPGMKLQAVEPTTVAAPAPLAGPEEAPVSFPTQDTGLRTSLRKE